VDGRTIHSAGAAVVSVMAVGQHPLALVWAPACAVAVAVCALAGGTGHSGQSAAAADEE